MRHFHKHPRPTHPATGKKVTDIFFLRFFSVSRKGEVKNNIQLLLQKVHVENFFTKKSTKISMSVFPRFKKKMRFRVFLSEGSSKALKKLCAQKIDQKKVQYRFPLYFFLAFGRFSARGGVKTPAQKPSKKCSTLSLFWPLTHPPTTGVRFSFAGIL
jgi:hypothetical protein